MVYGEVGKYPLQVTVNKLLIGYWLRILQAADDTIVHIMYVISLRLYTKCEYKSQWLCRVNSILNMCGLSYMWDDQHLNDSKK